MHLGGVLACFAEHINNFSLWILGIVGPVCNAYNHFIAVVGAFQTAFGNVYVIGQKF